MTFEEFFKTTEYLKENATKKHLSEGLTKDKRQYYKGRADALEWVLITIDAITDIKVSDQG